MKGRTKGLHREPDPAEERATNPSGAVPPMPMDAQPSGEVQQAMQMLTLAQRTAEEHVAVVPGHGEFAVVELGSVFTAVLVVAQGRLVDAAAGTRGPLGVRSGG